MMLSPDPRPDDDALSQQPIAGLLGEPDRGVGANAVWGLRELIFGVILVLFLFVIAGLSILPVTDKYGEDSKEGLIAQAIAVTIWDFAIIGMVYMLVRSKGGSWCNLGFQAPKRGLTGRDNKVFGLIAVIVIGFLVARLGVGAYLLMIDVLGLDSLLPDQQISDSSYDYTTVLIVLGFAIVIMAPIAEEIFFRGFVFAGLHAGMRMLLAGVISGALFSLAHGNIGLILPFTFVGFVLAYAYERTGSLYAPMGVHFLFNLTSFLALVFVPEAR